MADEARQTNDRYYVAHSAACNTRRSFTFSPVMPTVTDLERTFCQS